MNAKLPAPTKFSIDADFPLLETNPGPHDPNLITFETDITHWGVLRSYEAGVQRDGKDVFDVSTYSLGVKRQREKLWLKFQMLDKTVKDVVDHKYHLHATFSFLGEKIEIDWPPITSATEK